MEDKNFRSLRVWQLGMQIAEEVYRLSRQFPKFETYGLCSQIQCAAVSISSNIAEGHARGSSKEFFRFLGIAQGSLAELETQLMLAERLQYSTNAATGPILGHCTQEAKMLRNLRARVKSRIDERRD